MPDGAELTVPLPVPALATDSEKLLVPVGTNGDRNCPPITACAIPGPCQDTAKLSPPVASLCSTSM